jgi:thiol-disulfide isomerase/thioredoxin
MEMQLALAYVQTRFAYYYMTYAMNRRYALMKQQQDESAEWQNLADAKSYYHLRRIDFDNPLLFASSDFPHLLNRIQYAQPAMRALFSTAGQQRMDNYYAVLREMLGSKDNTLIAQLCLYQQMLTESRRWQTDKESKYAMFSNTFTHPYVKAKADEFYSRTMAQTELATPIPDAPMADLIRSLCAKYPGKILMIDFWGMGCGPCRGAIQASKELRAEIAKRDDVKLIFIAGERTADGSDAYKKYVAEWLANEETVCVTNADFTRLQELFQFNGIPHYETITPDCRRVRDDLRIDGYDNFDYELTRLKERLK